MLLGFIIVVSFYLFWTTMLLMGLRAVSERKLPTPHPPPRDMSEDHDPNQMELPYES